jgi:fructose-1,6-bisphosphatase
MPIRHCFIVGVRDNVVALALQENGQAVMFDRSLEAGKYVIVFDPLDGSLASRSIAFVPQAFGLSPDQNVPTK